MNEKEKASASTPVPFGPVRYKDGGTNSALFLAVAGV
jgi:hypothetical protein